MAKEKRKRTTGATVAYVLDPDLAIPDVMERNTAIKFGIKNKGAPVSFKNKKGRIKARGQYKKEKTDALNLIIDEIAPFIDLIVTPTLSAIDTPKKNMVFIKEEISSGEYASLNSFGKQLYVNGTDSLYDRYPVGSDYAGLIVPPPGRFGRLSALVVKDVSVKVRGRTTRNRIGMRHMLVRLIDGSLLEFYTIGSSLLDSKVESFFNKVIRQEPVILKKFILAPALTSDIGRPAYRIEKAIATLEGNEGLSTTPKTTEVVEYYYKSVPIEELITVSDSSVLDLSSILPSTIFFKGGNRKINDEYKKQLSRLIQKYSSMKSKSARHKTVFVALAKLQSTIYFDNTARGGSNRDLLHPAVLETILDEYIANKNRSSFIKVAVELMAGEAQLSAATLSGYCVNGTLPEESEIGVGGAIKTDTATLVKGKQLLAKYLPDVFGTKSKEQLRAEASIQAWSTAESKIKLSKFKSDRKSAKSKIESAAKKSDVLSRSKLSAKERFKLERAAAASSRSKLSAKERFKLERAAQAYAKKSDALSQFKSRKSSRNAESRSKPTVKKRDKLSRFKFSGLSLLRK